MARVEEWRCRDGPGRWGPGGSERDVKEGLGSDEGGEDSGGVTLAVEEGAVGGSTVGAWLALGMGDIAGYLRGDCPLGAGPCCGYTGGVGEDVVAVNDVIARRYYNAGY